MRHIFRYIICALFILGSLSGVSIAQVINIEDFGTGSYPGAALPAGQTTYIYNAPSQPANFPAILEDGEYVIATDSQQGFVNWASIGDNTTGSGYMMLVNADDNQAGEFYRAQVALTANTSYDFLTYLVNVNSQGDFDFCTNNQGGLILPNVTMQVEDTAGNILTSLDTGDIPFNATPVWDEYQLSFTTPASTSTVEIVLINNSVGGCGNDLAIDDITFRVAVTMEAFDDTVTITDTTNAQTAILLLGANDTLDGNTLPGTENYTVTPLSSLPSGITLNGSTGEVGIAAGTPQGTYTFDYQVCETNNMFNCDTATATIIVDFPPAVITADNDSGTVADSSTGFPSLLNVLDNDTIDGTSSPTDFELSISAGSSLPSGLTFDESTGDVGVLVGTPTGIYTFNYDLCELGDPTNCQIATVTIDVTNPGGAAFCPIGTSAFPGTYFVVSATNHPGQNQNADRTVGQPLPEGTTETGANSAITFFGAITMDLTGDPGILVPEGEVIEVSLSSSFGTQGRAEILMSADGVTYTSLGTTGQGGSVYGAFSSNIMRYDDFTVPAGGARFLQVLQQNQGVRADGVIYGTQCQPGGTPAAPIITASKAIETYDPTNIGLYSIPGNDVIYTISVENTGNLNVDDGSMLLIDILPAELSFYNADINDGFGPETDPVIFTDNGSGLTFTYPADVGFSQSTTAPTDFAACNYTPVPNSYDPLTSYICFNPKGEMLPNSDWAVSFRMRIE